MIDTAIIAGDIKNKHLDSASSPRKRDSLSSLSSGKTSIPLSKSPKPDEDGSNGETTPERTLSSSTGPITPGNQTPRSSDDNNIPASDYDIIADIIANATAAAASKAGTYSSLSSGKASIATESNVITTASTPIVHNRRSTLNSFFGGTSRSKSETTMTTKETRPRSLFISSSIFGKKRPESEEEKQLKEAGVTVKEIKSTLGKLVVPREITNPMPLVRLEAPQHAKLNR